MTPAWSRVSTVHTALTAETSGPLKARSCSMSLMLAPLPALDSVTENSLLPLNGVALLTGIVKLLAAVSPAILRRNVVVSGLPVIALKGRRFRIGTAVFEGTGDCDPCSRMEAALGPGGYNAMRQHGGLCARVIASGSFALGDAVEPLAPLVIMKAQRLAALRLEADPIVEPRLLGEQLEQRGDAANPITGYNLASLLYRRGEYTRAQFYIRRLNNSELANAETLWLGIKVERKLNNNAAVGQLAQQLERRYPKSREWAAYQRGSFHE